MKLVTIPLKQSQSISLKASNCFNDQTSNFVNKHLLVATPRNKHQRGMFDLFKLINKDTTVIDILFQRCCYHFWLDITFASRCFYCLFHMLIGVTYTDAKIQNTALHLFELLSRQFLENSPKITNQIFFKNLFGWLFYFGLFLLNKCHSRVEKSGGYTMGQNTGKSGVFCVISTTLI